MPYRNEYPKQVPIRTGEELTVKILGHEDSDLILGFFKLLSGRDSIFLRTDLSEKESVKRFPNFSRFDRALGNVCLCIVHSNTSDYRQQCSEQKSN